MSRRILFKKKLKFRDFDLIELLGEGSQGIVYLAEYKDSGKLYCLKLINYYKSHHSLESIKLCLNLFSIHQIKGLITYYTTFVDYYKEYKKLVVVMEYFQGNDLLERLPYIAQYKYPSIIYKVAKTLNKLHSLGYYHRDVKLENILINPKDEIRIIDLDFMINFEDEIVCGTPLYASPEMLNRGSVDYRSDIWAVGICLYGMLTEDYPFYSQSLDNLYYQIKNRPVDLEKVPLDYQEILLGLLTKNKEERLSLPKLMEMLKDRFLF